MASNKDISVAAVRAVEPPDSKPAPPRQGLYDDEDFAQFFEPVAKFEGKHLLDRSATWEPREEKALVRKIDKWILPWACFMFMAMQLDRGNISQALSDSFLKDLGMTTNNYNYGQTIYYVCFLVSEIPSQLVSKKLGVDRWVPIQITLWSIVAASQSALSGKSSFYATRAILGLLEGGFIPDAVLYLSYYYTTKASSSARQQPSMALTGQELQPRLTGFWISSTVTNIFGAFLAFGIFRLKGRHGLEGWRWLFLIEGVITAAIGILSWFYLPASPYQTKGKAFRPQGWFTEREEVIQANRIIRDDPSKGDMHNRQAVNLPLLYEAFKDYDMWPIYLLDILQYVPNGTLAAYLTITIRSLGFSTLNTTVLTVPSSVLYIINMSWQSWLAYYFNERTIVSSLTQWYTLPLLVALLTFPANENAWVKYAVYSLVVAYPFPHPIIVAWCSRNSGSVRTRTLSTAAYNMMGNIGFIIQSNIYRADDAPLYRRGNKVLIGICAFNILSFAFIKAYYILRNRHRSRIWDSMSREEQLNYLATTTDSGNKRLDFRFIH